MASATQCLRNQKIPDFGTRPQYLTKTAGKIGNGKWEKLGLNQQLTPCNKTNSKWVNDFNLKRKIISKLGEHRVVYLSDLWERAAFKLKQEIESIAKCKMNNFDYIKKIL